MDGASTLLLNKVYLLQYIIVKEDNLLLWKKLLFFLNVKTLHLHQFSFIIKVLIILKLAGTSCHLLTQIAIIQTRFILTDFRQVLEIHLLYVSIG